MIDGFPLSFFLPLVMHTLAGLMTGVTGIVAFRAPNPLDNGFSASPDKGGKLGLGDRCSGVRHHPCSIRGNPGRDSHGLVALGHPGYSPAGPFSAWPWRGIGGRYRRRRVAAML